MDVKFIYRDESISRAEMALYYRSRIELWKRVEGVLWDRVDEDHVLSDYLDKIIFKENFAKWLLDC